MDFGIYYEYTGWHVEMDQYGELRNYIRKYITIEKYILSLSNHVVDFRAQILVILN